jgi:hypothetical protein
MKIKVSHDKDAVIGFILILHDLRRNLAFYNKGVAARKEV